MEGNVDFKQKISEEVTKFQTLRDQYKKVLTMRAQLEAQLNENKIVKEELELLEKGTPTFKLIGPALVKIDLKDAKENVNNRIKYITAEMTRHEQTMESLSKQQDKLRDAVLKLEQQAQQTQQACN